MSPNSHSTDTRTELVDPLNISIWGVRAAPWNVPCRWTLRGYAGSPYMHRGWPPCRKCMAFQVMQETRFCQHTCIMPFALWNKKLKVSGLFHEISLFFIMQRFCKIVSWDQPFIALINQGVCRRLYCKIDTWRGKQLPSETMFVPFPFELLFS